jgi:hypothetical protein
MLKITDRNIFFSFKNGYTVSVFYGKGSYSEKKNDNEFRTVEVAVIYNDKFVPIDGDDVSGWVTPEDVIKILHHYSSSDNPAPLSLEKTELEAAYDLGTYAAEDYAYQKEYSINPYSKDNDLSKSWLNGFHSNIEDV